MVVLVVVVVVSLCTAAGTPARRFIISSILRCLNRCRRRRRRSWAHHQLIRDYKHTRTNTHNAGWMAGWQSDYPTTEIAALEIFVCACLFWPQLNRAEPSNSSRVVQRAGQSANSDQSPLLLPHNR